SRHFGELAYRCRVILNDAGLVFESESATARVNGWRCNRRIRLRADDQVVLGEHRLVVEAPAMQYASHAASLPPVAPTPREPEPGDVVHGQIGWLIGAALVLAAIIAMFLYFRW
ncbi:MAG: hypothetical protein KGJ94_10830, partial [Xanthomonadaceae bacterium]|nr:hypothetical protein [Xanthomonadaceae bacterium]